MKSPVKHALVAVGVIVMLAVVVLGAGIAQMLVGLRPTEDGRQIGNIRIVMDGFSAIGVVSAGPRELVLIDAGQDQTGQAINAELTRRQLPPEAVKAVFLTHGHGDHIGAIRALPQTEVIALAAEKPIAEGTQAPRSPMGWLMPTSPTGITVTRTVRDGEIVTVGTASVRVYAMPGHTAGSAAYLVDGDVLFLGDSAQINRKGEIRPAPWLVTDDRAENRASLAQLQRRLTEDGVRVKAIVPAHSGPADGDAALVAFAQTTR